MRYQEFNLREDGSAKLCAYLLDPAISFRKYKTRPAIVLCPGGAYLTLATKEGEAVAARWLGLGFDVFVVRYLHYFAKRPGEEGPGPVIDGRSHVPEQLVDLMASMRLVHKLAGEWDIDERRIYAMGFSAGGHLVGSLAERWDDAELLERAGGVAPEQAKPAGVIMGYPMISACPLCDRPEKDYPVQMVPSLPYMRRGIFGTEHPTQEQFDAVDLTKHVRPDMPRVFVWHTTEDTVVDPRETVAFVGELLAAGVPCELHLYQSGLHGTALCDESSASSATDVVPDSQNWVAMAKAWTDKDVSSPEYCHE